MHESSLPGGGARLEFIGFRGALGESESGEPGTDGTGGDHENVVSGLVKIRDSLGKSGENRVINLAPGAAREHAGADLDNHPFACCFLRHIRIFRERVANSRRAGRYGRVTGV